MPLPDSAAKTKQGKRGNKTQPVNFCLCHANLSGAFECLVSGAAPVGQRFPQLCDGVGEYGCCPAPGSLLLGFFGLPRCPPEAWWGWSSPPKPTVVGDGPTGRCGREILGGDTLPKVEVAVVVALTAGKRDS